MLNVGVRALKLLEDMFGSTPPTREDASHHQVIITFLVGDPFKHFKPSFATFTGWGVDSTNDQLKTQNAKLPLYHHIASSFKYQSSPARKIIEALTSQVLWKCFFHP